MKLHLKKAALQNSVPTNRNRIRRHIYLGKQAHHCNAPRIQKGRYVDTAVIEGKKMFLPGEVSKVTCSYMEKSAEVIVLTGNELGQNPRGLTSKEGPNVILFKIRIGAHVVAYA
ncbi:hypothetical protein Q4603_21175 [Zobellia galactanivorans]|uniref:hypothetical protein n=1 Tax=Zobellia galactanivorans (strain DSM 12802 / CCUG 47099 / CIP 106680 / NCIMB 13871 / Dsij) TaxID=63186 RepID=UPI0026E2E25F|nr:hypothetical protein [Zobellia galactanivorans]MDO6811146.1 hypothetical protein [Zobellia galactanivorans]